MLPLIVIIQWDFCLTTARYLVSSSSSLSESHEETEQTETDQIQKNFGNVFKMLQETSCKVTVC